MIPLASLKNLLDFPLRRLIRWRRRGLVLPAQAKKGLFPAAVEPEVQRLVARYRLDDWERMSGCTDFAASLFYLQMLERALAEAGARLPAALTALDAGPGDWFYVRALHGLLAYHDSPAARPVELDGVEIDPYRVYRDFYSRADWAHAYMAGLPGLRYLAGDVLAYTRAVDAVFLLFPFLFAADLAAWGLPRRYLRPAALLQHLHGLLRPGGVLLIANSGEAEQAEQHRLLHSLGLPVAWWGAHDSPLFTYRRRRYITVVTSSR